MTTSTDTNRSDATGQPDAETRSTAALDGDAHTRQCGRCRRRFPSDASTHPVELLDWWACQPCADALLPGRHRTTSPGVEQHGSPS